MHSPRTLWKQVYGVYGGEHGNITGVYGGEHGNAGGTNTVLVEQTEVKQGRDSARQDSNPVKDTVGDSDSIIESIIIHPNITSPDDPDQYKENGGDAAVNTFECLTPSLDVGGDLASTSYDIPDTAKYSDTSPICDTFNLIKRIDELDYSPSLPLSKSELKRLRKQRRASKQGDGNKVTSPHD